MDYYSIEVELGVNSKRDLTEQALVSHHAYVPNVDLLVVLDTHDYLGRVIKRTSN